jgi:hypothetical protein
MAKGNNGVLYPDPFNEVDNKDPNKPDVMGNGIYYDGWDEVMKMHLKETGDLVSTSNSDASHDTFGGPTTGEPNPAGSGGMGGKGGK